MPANRITARVGEDGLSRLYESGTVASAGDPGGGVSRFR
jgi:hypothetical protein